MLRLVLGRSGSGKSALVTEELARRAREGKGGAFLIVPEQYSHEKEREIGRIAGDSASACVEVLSFKRLCRRILAAAGGAARPMLSDGGRLLVMRSAVLSVLGELRAYAASAARADFLPKLAAAIDELIRCRVTPEALSATAKRLPEGTVRAKVSDLALIYTAYTALTAVGAADPRCEADLAAERLRESGIFDSAEMVIDGFAGFTPQEWELVAGLMQRAERLTVCLAAPDGEAPFEGPDGVARRLERMATRRGIVTEYVRLSENRRARRPALAALENGFFRRGAEAFAGDCEGVEILHCRSRNSEVMAVAAEIRRLVLSEGWRYRDFAVLSRDFSAYERICESVFADYAIPAFADTTHSMAEGAVYRLLSSALDVVLHRFDSEYVLKNLRCGLSGFPERAMDMLEGYVRIWRMPGWKWTTEKPWAESPRGLCNAVTDEDAQTLRRLDCMRRKAVAPLVRLSKALEQGGTARQLCGALYTYTEDIRLVRSLSRREKELKAAGRLREADELRQQYAVFCESLDQMVEAGESLRYTGREFCDALRTLLGAESIGSIPDSLDSVPCGEMGRMRISAPRAVFILGANDGILPAAPKNSALLGDAEREALRAAGAEFELAPSGYDAAAAEEFILYNALAAPSERLYILVPEKDETGSALRPSYVPGRVLALLPGARESTACDDESRTYSPAGLAELACGEGSLAEAARGLLSGHPATALTERSLRRYAAPDAPVADTELNRALFGKRLHISASRMEKYAACRFRYFAEVGLRAKEPREAKLSPAESGTFIHYVLEQVAKDVKARGGWRCVKEEAVRALARMYAEKFLASPEGIPEDVRDARMIYYIHRLTADVCDIVVRMHAEFRVSDFEPAGFEIDLSDGSAPVIWRFGGEEAVIVGRVDRADTWQDGEKTYLRVVDYKTGNKEMNYTDIRAGLSVQMLLYLFVLADRSGNLPAGVLYSRASMLRIPAERGLTEEEYARERDKKQRPTGLVLSDAQVLEAMERDVAPGEGARFLPLDLKRDGTPKKEDFLLAAEEFLALRRHVDTLLKKMTAELRRGEVTPNPYAKKQKEDRACRSCPFAAVCRFDEGRPECRPNYLEKTDKESFFAGEKEGELRA
ncbi:MAG: PD-(D/E)XK nuclease family protein [Clostridia bacterium]|nr:PD-(D/E)XK nuclease family protein [Clostridia bacterium]